MQKKGHINTEGVLDKQAFNWFREGFKDVLKEEDRIALQELVDRVEADFAQYKRSHTKWKLVLPKLTAKQKETLLEEL